MMRTHSGYPLFDQGGRSCKYHRVAYSEECCLRSSTLIFVRKRSPSRDPARCGGRFLNGHRALALYVWRGPCSFSCNGKQIVAVPVASRSSSLCLVVVLGCLANVCAAQSRDPAPALVKLTNAAGKVIVCELLGESENEITVSRLITGKKYVVNKGDLAGIERGVTASQAIELIGLTRFAAWRTVRATGSDSQKKIAILPFLDNDGRESELSQLLSRDLTSVLQDRGVSVVDRQHVQRLLGDRRPGDLLEGMAVRLVGQLEVAAILTGTVVKRPPLRETRLRLLDAGSGQALFTISHTIQTAAVSTALRTPSLLRFVIPHEALSVAFSPDSLMIATSGIDGVVNVWDASGDWQFALPADHGRVYDVAFSGDGKQLAASFFDGTVTVWDVESRREVMSVAAHARIARAVAFSDDSSLLASAGDDRTIKLWEVPENQERAVLRGHANFVRCVAFSHDGRWLASAGNDRAIRLWNLATGTSVATLHGHRGYVYSVAFSPLGKTLASASSDGTTKLWDLTRRIQTATIAPEAGATHCVQFSPDGRWLATCHADETVKIWNARTQEHVITLDDGDGTAGWLAFSPDGMLLAAACADGQVRVWDTLSVARAARVRR